MKTLLLMRHAKSSWEDTALDDFDRPLNDRGRRNAPFMGAFLKHNAVEPGMIVSSPAVRALSTALVVAEAIGYPAARVTTDRRLYDASARQIADVVGEWSDYPDTVLLVGHNPGLTHLVNLLTGARLDNVPTAGIAFIDLDIQRWSDVRDAIGRLRLFEYPKKYPDGQ